MIKTIVFDLGGVYFTAGTPIAIKKIYDLVNVPKKKVDELFSAHPRKEGFLYRKGKLTKYEFWYAAIKKLKINNVSKLQEIWHDSYEPIVGMQKLTDDLRKKYRVIVFSDTIRERVECLDKKYHFKKHFDYLLFSFNVGFNKYEKGFYKILLKKINCNPAECIFIDNARLFLKTASAFGVNTILFNNVQDLKSKLKKFGVILS